MRLNVKTTNIQMTPAISGYLDKRLSAFDKFISANDQSVKCDVEIGKTTRHHRSGDIFKAEVNLHIAGKDFYAVSERSDLYTAIDEVNDETVRLITQHKDRNTTLMRRGAATVKNILKGLGGFGRRNRK